MVYLLRPFLLVQIFAVARCFFPPPIDSEIRPLTYSHTEGDAGEPLFLTPYIENGNITEGRLRARVLFTEKFKVKSYSGFFTVNKTYNSNQFFWYFPPLSSDTKTAPVIIWLQGGPGASSLLGLFNENGPLSVTNGSFTNRKLNWAISHHVIYIDNPVGSGFSFTDDKKGYCTDQDQVGEELYSTVVQFLQLFPELQQNELFITGESYAGKYVPALSYAIHKKNPNAQVKVNLKGLAIGNGLSDPGNQIMYSKYLNQLGLIDWKQEEQLKIYEKQAVEYIKGKKWMDAAGEITFLLSYIAKTTGCSLYNYLEDSVSERPDEDEFASVICQSSVRKDIHVGNLSYFLLNTLVYSNLKFDIPKSVTPWISELLDYYDVLIYNGQLDIIVAYPLTVNYLRNLNYTASEQYTSAERYQWIVDGEVAGYVKKAGRLTEILVRNAGHMVPTDQPKWALDIITKFTHRQMYNLDGHGSADNL